MSVVFPSFYIANDNPSEIKMYSCYFIDVENGLETSATCQNMADF